MGRTDRRTGLFDINGDTFSSWIKFNSVFNGKIIEQRLLGRRLVKLAVMH